MDRIWSKQAKCPRVFVNMFVLFSQRGLTLCPWSPSVSGGAWPHTVPYSAPWTEERDSGLGGGTGEGLAKDRALVHLLPPPTHPPPLGFVRLFHWGWVEGGTRDICDIDSNKRIYIKE